MNLEIKIPSDEPVRLLSPEGKSAPDHNTIARFRREHLPYAVEDLLNQMVKLLVECGEISFEESVVFIDGTKIEANANRYSFVWNYRALADYTSETEEAEEAAICKKIG